MVVMIKDKLGLEVQNSPSSTLLLFNDYLTPRADLKELQWYLDAVFQTPCCDALTSFNMMLNVQQIAAALESLWQARLTANPGKCAVGKREVQCLRNHKLARCTLRWTKHEPLQLVWHPRNRRRWGSRQEVKLTKQRFVPNFADLTFPLTTVTIWVFGMGYLCTGKLQHDIYSN